MQQPLETREDALAFLLGRIDYERTHVIPYARRGFKLGRMRRLLAALGDPHLGLSAIHVAGTKGKGSTCVMLAEILRAAGYRTALYTSPHLDRIEERFMIDGRPCDEAVFVELVREVAPVVADFDRRRATAGDDQGPTYFEITTAMAFLHFARSGAEVAVLEVGLGGRLDSTNVCRPLVTAITSISFDHTGQLGTTLAAIAGEKAGIIKPGVPVVSSVVEPEPCDAITAVALRRGSPLIQRDIDFAFLDKKAAEEAPEVPGGRRLDFFAPAAVRAPRLADVAIGMLGHHQAANAATAIAVVESLRDRGFPIGDAHVRHGLKEAKAPARVEVIQKDPLFIVDAAHNVASAAALADTLRTTFPDLFSEDRGLAAGAPSRTLVFATSSDKDAAGMMRRLAPLFDRVLLTRYENNPRFIPPDQLKSQLGEILAEKEVVVCRDPLAAGEALASGPADAIVIAGSFFIAAEMRALFNPEPQAKANTV